MPPEHDAKSPERTGTLYVVATPIGNLEDITLRAVRVLGEADLVAAEDTRRTKRLLDFHRISTPTVSCHEHNEESRSEKLVELLSQGKNVALASDAGTPSLSDPGYRLIKRCVEKDIRVSPVPGPSSAVAAICASGLPTDSFVFLGFAPRKKGKRNKLLENLAGQPRTMVFFESPNRILSFVEELIAALGDREAALAREMTKIHEEFVRGRLSSIASEIRTRSRVRGECTLVVQGAPEERAATESELRERLKFALEQGETLSEAVKTVAEMSGSPRKKVYREALKLKSAK